MIEDNTVSEWIIVELCKSMHISILLLPYTSASTSYLDIRYSRFIHSLREGILLLTTHDYLFARSSRSTRKFLPYYNSRQTMFT